MILNIGMAKSGSSSLSAALWELGIESYHVRDKHNEIIEHQIEDNLCIGADMFYGIDGEAFCEFNGYKYVEQIADQYPDAKIIITIRDRLEFIHSYVDHHVSRGRFTNTDEAAAIYDHMLSRFNWLEENSDNDILYLHTSIEDKWEELCLFLGKPKPTKKYPYISTTRKPPAGIHDSRTIRKNR